MRISNGELTIEEGFTSRSGQRIRFAEVEIGLTGVGLGGMVNVINQREFYLMKINRVMFIGLWVLFTALLYILPGFEIRGLAMGLIIGVIIGYIPFIILEQFGITQHSHFFLILIAVFIFSGAYVVLLSWLIDKLKVFNRPHVIILAVSVLLSCITISSLGHSYKGWRRSSIVQQDLAHSENTKGNYKATRWDYRKQIAIPKALAGCQIGLYIALLLCAISSIVIYKKRKREVLDEQEKNN